MNYWIAPCPSTTNPEQGFQVMVSDPGTSLSGCRVALLSCGQFDPPSYAHLRMFERARDFLVRTMGCKVVEGVMSVAGDSPSTRTSAKHRLRMVETAVRKNFWIRAGDYECTQSTPVRQIAVLKHYQKKISQKHDEPIRMLYVCGSEVLDELVAVQSDGCCLWTHAEKNIYVIEDETFPNDLRCSRIRTALRRGESVKYCLDDDVIEYINDHNLYQTNSKTHDDDKVVPPEPPQRSSSEGLSEKYKNITIPSAEWRTPPSSQPSSSASCSSREASEPRHLPPKPQSARELPSAERYSVKWSDTTTEIPAKSKSEHQLNRPEYTTFAKKEPKEQKTNHMTISTCDKQTVAATFTLCRQSTESKKSSEDKSSESSMNGIPSELPKTAFMKPILSQPQPAADSPLFNGKATDCEEIPNCVISSVTSDAKGTLRTLAESPAYDNVTLDDLLAASTSWAEYLHKESERIGGMRNDDYKESLVPNDPPPSKEQPHKEEKKKRGWFFNRSKSLKDLKPQPEDETLVRICATDRREQTETSPEILWRRINQSSGKDRWSDLPPSPKPQCPRHPGRRHHAEVPRKDSKGIRFGLTKSAENVYSTSSRPAVNGRVPGGQLPAGLSMSQSHCEGVTSPEDGVTLRFRRYKLTSTPETTV
ncbi:putative nicotinate-nucleotide adenylyltransferase [Ancylostoma ceylanicum]|uniref:Putative nicotinate-nucleotide adenylyltransferase n=1 Tax=Ancylostoma ceylanicum TaxID=53326 RepID=A0A0D6LEJ4_9BILA|nr:putative nicotinate-nucleotide adenylyltransferase [Ancylostoma ceylanicum]